MSEASPTTSSTSPPSPSEGDQSDASGSLRGFVWGPDGVVAEVNDLDVLQRAHNDPETRIWIDVEGASEATLSAIAKCLGLHPLTAEDIIERNQRAKIEYTAGTMHLVLFALLYEGEVISAELDIVLGTDFLLTSHPPEWRPVDAPNIARNGVAHYLGIGVDHVLWAVVDAAVDGYFPVFDKLGDEIDDLQDQVLSRPNRWLVERLFQLRRDLLQIRHAVSPEREVFNQLTNRENPLIHRDRIIYFRDVYDHLIRLTDELDSYREMVSTTLEAYLSSVNNSLSEVMKRLTAVTAVLAGAGALAGIFGMSEAGLALSFEDLRFWFVTGIIGILSFLGFVYFRRIGYV
ncbi:MAG: magnesium transporter CorA family protein [Chloroflexi bacterium]|nr:magnesium transporter CorA family protein [Chloroflexota bacterium]